VIVENIVNNVYAKFNGDWLWNEKALVHWKSDNNNKNNIGRLVVLGDPFPGPKNNL